MSAIYQIMYRYWSSQVHVIDIRSGGILAASDGKAAFVQLRDPSHAQRETSFALSFGLSATTLAIAHFAPSKKRALSQWYRKEIQPGYRKVGGRPPLLTVVHQL